MLSKVFKFIFENEFMLILAYLGIFGLGYAILRIIDSFKRKK